MSKPKFTPGPWCYEVKRAEDVIIAPLRGERSICSMSLHQPVSSEVILANAQLMAAAPLMVEALEMASHSLRLAGKRNDANHLDKIINLAIGGVK